MLTGRKKDAEGKTEKKSKNNRTESKDIDIKYFSFLFAALYPAFTKDFETYNFFNPKRKDEGSEQGKRD